MARYDVVDDGLIDADCSTVFKAYTDEFMGLTHWWMPYWQTNPRSDDTIIQKGTVGDTKINYKGRAKFAGRVTELIEDKLVNVEFFEGDFIGTVEWTFEPVDGKTKVRCQWKVKTNGLALTLVAPFINIGKQHSEVVQEGFKALNRCLRRKLKQQAL